MTITVQHEADALLVLLAGRLDGTTSATVEPAMMDAVAAGRGVVLDLSGTTYVSSMGLRLILLVAKRVKQAGRRLALCGLQPQVQEVFEIGNFASLLTIVDTRQEARSLVRDG